MNDRQMIDPFSLAVMKSRYDGIFLRAELAESMYKDREAMIASKMVDDTVQALIEGGPIPEFLTEPLELVSEPGVELLKLYFNTNIEDALLPKLASSIVDNIALGVSKHTDVSMDRIADATKFILSAMSNTK